VLVSIPRYGSISFITSFSFLPLSLDLIHLHPLLHLVTLLNSN